MAEWDWTYAGVAFGGATGIDVNRVDGWLDLPDVRTADAPRSRANGYYAGLDLAGVRTIRFEIEVIAPDSTAAWALIAPLQNVTVVQAAEQALVGQTPGLPAIRALCRPRRRNTPIEWDRTIGAIRMDLEFQTTNPLLLADTASSAVSALALATTGLTFSAAAPFVFGSVTGNTIAATNAGNYDADWTATFTGPLVAPELVHVATGKRISLTGANLAAGETLIVDSASRTVKLNGTASRYSWLSTTSQWFTLAPGSNAVTFLGASGAGNVTLSWRSAWM